MPLNSVSPKRTCDSSVFTMPVFWSINAVRSVCQRSLVPNISFMLAD